MRAYNTFILLLVIICGPLLGGYHWVVSGSSTLVDSCGCDSCTHFLTSSYCTQDTPYRVHPVDLRGMGVIIDSFCVNPAFRLNLLSCVR